VSKLEFSKVTYTAVFLCWYVIWIPCLSNVWENQWQISAQFVVMHSSKRAVWVSFSFPLPSTFWGDPSYSLLYPTILRLPHSCCLLCVLQCTEIIVFILEWNRWTSFIQMLSRLWWYLRISQTGTIFSVFKAVNSMASDIQCIAGS